MTNEVTQKTTSNEQNVSSSNGLEPKIRFASYSENYTICNIEDIFDERSERGSKNLELLSVTMNDGVKKRIEIEGKDNSSEDKGNYKIVHVGDMVYNSMRMWQGANGISPYDGIVSPAYTVLKASKPLCNKYIAYQFKNSNLINKFRKNSQGLTSDTWNLKYPQISTIKIYLPSLPEQQKIAVFLSLVDARIEKQRQLVESLKKYKRGVIFHLFNKNNPINKSIPMRDLLTEINDRDAAGLRVCSVAVVKGVVDQIEHLGRSFAASDTSKYRRVHFGDVVYTKSPTGDFPFGIVKQSKIKEDVAVSPLYGVYKPSSYSTGNLLHLYFEQYQYANNYIRSLAQKGAKNTINITTQHFLEKNIIFPYNEVDRVYFSNFFEELNKLIKFNDVELEKAQFLKKGLLQQMFI